MSPHQKKQNAIFRKNAMFRNFTSLIIYNLNHIYNEVKLKTSTLFKRLRKKYLISYVMVFFVPEN